MNPYPNYGYQYSQGQPYNWYPQYYNPGYGQGQEYYNYYTPQPYNYPQRNIYPNYEVNEYKKTQPQVIKLQQDSCSNGKNPPSNNSVQAKKSSKKSKKKLVLPKLSQTDKNIYVHPPKQVQNKVKYFDPSSAPVVTSSFYNLVEDIQKQVKRNEQIYLLNEENPNQILYPQEDYENPFIKFRFRRIKKKFKKYIKPKDQFFYGQKAEEDYEYNDSDNSSLSSEEDSDEDYSKNRRKSRRRTTTTVKQVEKKETIPKQSQIVLNISSSQAQKSQK